MKTLRFTIIALLLNFTTLYAHAQAPVGYHKDKPVQIIQFRNVYTETAAPWFKKKLDRKAGFTEAEAATIMSRIAAGGDKPNGINDFGFKASVMSHYKAYQQYYFSRFGFEYAIVWLPYEENQHMPDSLRPKGKEGCIFLLDGKYVTTEGKDAGGTSLPVAGTPVPAAETAPRATASNTSSSGTTASGVQYSKADMSALVPACWAAWRSTRATVRPLCTWYPSGAKRWATRRR